MRNLFYTILVLLTVYACAGKREIVTEQKQVLPAVEDVVMYEINPLFFFLRNHPIASGEAKSDVPACNNTAGSHMSTPATATTGRIVFNFINSNSNFNATITPLTLSL